MRIDFVHNAFLFIFLCYDNCRFVNIANYSTYQLVNKFPSFFFEWYRRLFWEKMLTETLNFYFSSWLFFLGLAEKLFFLHSMHVARKRQNYEVQGAIKIAIYTLSHCKIIHSKICCLCRVVQSFLEGGKGGGGGGGLKEEELRIVVFLKSRRKKNI